MTNYENHKSLKSGLTGYFGRRELAIMGTTCEEVEQLVHKVVDQFGKEYHLGYVDAHHQSGEEPINSPLSSGLKLLWTDFQYWEQVVSPATNPYERKLVGQNLDVVFVNGNHHQANQQIVVLNEKKINSLRKRWSQLTQVIAILEPPVMNSELTALKGEILKMFPSAQVLQKDNLASIMSWFQNWVKESAPQLYSLVLAGGKSVRMGQDKGQINYHGQPQREYLYELLKPITDEVFMSIRPDQTTEMGAWSCLPDEFLGLGPYGALLTAFKNYPNKAWLIVAVDMPQVNQTTLQYLIQHRHPSAIATAFQSPVDNFPDPVLAIWEPKSYGRLLQFLSLGITCPRKVLINSYTNLLSCPEPAWLLNINTSQEYQNFIKE